MNEYRKYIKSSETATSYKYDIAGRLSVQSITAQPTMGRRPTCAQTQHDLMYKGHKVYHHHYIYLPVIYRY